MKKLFALTLMMLPLALPLFAQDDCKMCGDWVGVYNGTKPHPTEERLIPADYKLYVRIKRIEDNISVRLKCQLADNSAAAWYMNDWKVSDYSENRIVLVWDGGDDDNGGDGWDIINGKKCAYRRDIIYASLELTKGILYFNGGTNYGTWYDKYGNVLDTFHFDASIPARNVTLYKDDDDW